MENRNDLRYQRTDHMIKEAYKQLMLKKNYAGIHVKEVCEEAMISRRTFYSHFNSIDDLLKSIQLDLSKEFFDEIKDFDHIENVDKIVETFFHFADEHGMIFERINYDMDYNYLRSQITKQISGMSVNNFKSISHFDKYSRNMILTFMNASCVGMYRQWISDGRRIPQEQAIKMASELIGEGLKSIKKKD